MAKNHQKKKKTKFKKFLSSAGLKASLLRIWFLKNLKTFLLLAVIVYAIVVLTGNAEGGIIFGGLSSAIANVTSSSTVGDVMMSILAVVLSLGSGFFLFWKKTKFIQLQDIKSKKLKLAMIQAGLYFDQRGRLTKRAKKPIEVSLDENGKVTSEENEVTPASEFAVVTNTIGAVTELGTILTTKIEDPEDYSETGTPIVVDEEKPVEDPVISNETVLPDEEVKQEPQTSVEEEVVTEVNEELTKKEKRELRRQQEEEEWDNAAREVIHDISGDISKAVTSDKTKQSKIKKILSYIMAFFYLVKKQTVKIAKAIKRQWKKIGKKDKEKGNKLLEELPSSEGKTEEIMETVKEPEVDLVKKNEEAKKEVAEVIIKKEAKEEKKAEKQTEVASVATQTNTTMKPKMSQAEREAIARKKQKEIMAKRMNDLFK